MARTSQADRRASTRRALLDATVETLVERGYAETTTTAIVKRAGVSQGALFAHFATKADLLGAVLEDLYPRLVDSYGARIAAGIRSDPDSGVADQVLRPLLEAMQRPDTRAAIELTAASRTDPGLAARLVPIEVQHRAAMRLIARQVLADVAPGVTREFSLARLDTAVDLALDLVLGISLSTAVAGADRIPAELALAGELLAPFLSPALTQKV